jgi:UDP-glucose-4-epimerase GalE
MRILVTGGAGYIGSHTVRLLLERGHDVRVYDNLCNGHRAAVPAGRLIVGDVGDAACLDEAISEHDVEAIVHFAAYAYVGESVRSPGRYYQNNLQKTLALMECARRRGVGRFVFSSTCATYGVPRRVPIDETEPQSPVNPYGRTKLAIEHALEDFVTAYDWAAVALRYFNAAGAHPDGTLGEDHDPETHLIPRAIQVALGRLPHLDVFGTDYDTPDGTCVRDYVHVQDLARAHLLAVEAAEPGRLLKYNLGSQRGYSVREVIRTVEEVSGERVSVREAARRAGDPPVLVASARKIEAELGWRAECSTLGHVVETAWRWHLAHPQGHATSDHDVHHRATRRDNLAIPPLSSRRHHHHQLKSANAPLAAEARTL